MRDDAKSLNCGKAEKSLRLLKAVLQTPERDVFGAVNRVEKWLNQRVDGNGFQFTYWQLHIYANFLGIAYARLESEVRFNLGSVRRCGQ